MNKKTVIFRVDCSPFIGFGHFIRCLNFARFLRAKGVVSHFITKSYDSVSSELLKKHEFTADFLNPEDSLKQEEEFFLSKNWDPNQYLMFFDITHLTNIKNKKPVLELLSSLKQAGYTLACFDDFDFIPFEFDLQIIPYVGAENYSLKATHSLLGGKYYFSNFEFEKNAKKQKEIHKNISTILVSLGGSDPYELTLDSLEALEIAQGISESKINLVITKSFSPETKNKIDTFLSKTKRKIQLIENGNMPELYFNADLAITGVGLSRYEAAMVGTPCFCLTRVDLKDFAEDKFIDSGVAPHFTLQKPEHVLNLANQISEVATNQKRRQQLSTSSKSLVDGMGAYRIYDFLIEKGCL